MEYVTLCWNYQEDLIGAINISPRTTVGMLYGALLSPKLQLLNQAVFYGMWLLTAYGDFIPGKIEMRKQGIDYSGAL